MKKFLQHRKGAFALLLALFLGMGTAYAYDFSATCPSGQTLYYNITDATNHYVEITCPGTPNEDGWQGFTKPTGNITLPSEATYNSVTYTVTKIGDYAFYGCNGLTGTLNISATVTTIGHFAFANCYGFTGSLTIPNSVTLIGHYAFMNCQGFTGSLTIPNSVTLIDYGAFRECYGFTGSLIIGSSVTTISNYAFANCRFTSMMVLPETPPSLGMNVFENVPTSTPVYVPCDQVSAYQNASGWSSFNDMQCLDILTYSINDDGVSVTVTGNLYGTAATGPLVIPETKTIDGVTYTVTTIGQNAFLGCSGFTGNLAIPNSVTTIGFQAFAECSGFTGSLSIPNSVTTIDFGAFGWCPNFTGTLTLSNSLTVIGDFAFYLDSGFTGMLTIPNSVTSIGESAFSSCSFTGLTLGNSLTTIGDHAFHACHTFTGPLTIPNSLTTIGSHAFYACDGFTSLTLGNSVTTIGSWAFHSCDGLRGSLTIPNSVTTIGNRAFAWCLGFNGTLTVGQGVTSMGEGVFNGCSGFSQVKYNAINCADVTYEAKPFEGCGGTLTIGNAVQRIPSYMFYECTSLSGPLTIGNSVTSIGFAAFDGCGGFTGSLTIPNSVITIENYAFNNCSGFNGTLTLPNSVTSIGWSAFNYCYFTGPLILPDSLTTIEGYTFYNCHFTGSLVIPNSVTTIKYCAFFGCHFDGSLSLPNSLTTIEDVAFAGCNFTGSLTIPGSVTTIGYEAFHWCNGFTDLIIGASVTSIGHDAFGECTGLTSMMLYPETPPTLGSNAFQNVPNAIPVRVPCGKLNVYRNASGWNAFANMTAYCDPLTYSINPDGVSVTVTGHEDGINATGPLFIPETKTIDGVTYTVTAIAQTAFSECSGLTGSLTIPNTVTSIGRYAFQVCTGFTGTLTLPNSLTTLSPGAFYLCSGFTGNLTLPNSITVINKDVFCGCSGFTGSLTIPNTVTSIGENAFWGCSGLTGSLTIPDSVTAIGNYAFNNCTGFDGTLTISTGVTSIGKGAFNNCTGFTQVNFNAVNCADVDNDAKPFKGCGGALTIGNAVQRIPSYMFFEADGLTSLTLSNSVTTVGACAFAGCEGFTGSLTIPNSVTEIEFGAFGWCPNFDGTLTLGSSLTTIGEQAFYVDSGFTGSLTIPNSVTTIGRLAFKNCTGFTGDLTIGHSVTSIGDNAFIDCTGFTHLNFNAINCADIPLSDSERPPFQYFTGTISFDDAVQRIPAWMFYKCSGFTGWLNLPSSLTSIGMNAFQECSGLEGWLMLPESLTEIGAAAFYKCSGFTGSLTIPNSLTTIGNFTFGLTGITSVTIPESVTSMGIYAFGWCNSLSTITVRNETPPVIESSVFYNVPKNIDVYAPCSSISAYQSAEGWSEFTNYQCLPWTVTLTANPYEGGNAVFVVGDGNYATGDECTVQATPNANYQFMHWNKNGAVVSSNASYTFYVNGNTELEAVFMPLANAGTIIGEGEDTHGFLPSSSLYKYSMSQQIYTAAEMGGSFTINNISFFNAGNEKTRDYVIYMVHTSKASFSSVTDWVSVTNSNIVFSGEVTFRTGVWTTIVLDTPFVYNGTSNFALVVDDNTGEWTGNMSCRVYEANGNQALYGRSDGVNYNPLSPTSTNVTLAAVKNQVIFNRPVYTITATPNDASMGTVTGAGQYAYGELCRLKATANSGHTFLDWMRIDGVAVTDESEYEFVVTGDMTLRANFFEGTDVCNLTFNFDNYDQGWVDNYLEVHFGNGMSHLFGVLNDEATASYTLPFVNGNHVKLNMQNGTFSNQYPFEVRYANGNLACASVAITGEETYEFDMDCDDMPAAWVYLGDGDDITNYYLPGFTFYAYTLSQQIYTANEIGTAGNISSIAFYNQGENNTKTRTYDIYLKPTSKFEFFSNNDWIPVTEEDKVFSGQVTMVSNEWTVITFDKPFVYDGTSNLVLVMDDNTGSYSFSPHMACRIYDAAGDQALYLYNDGWNYDPTDPSAYIGTLLNDKNQVYFGFTSSIDCWTPAFLTTTNITSYSATLDWTGSQDSYNLRYRVAPPFYEDFEDEETFATEWTFISMNTGNDIGAGSNAAGLDDYDAHSGEYSFRFSSYNTASDYNQYLVSSRLTVTGELKFFYKKYNNNLTETLEVGYSTTTNDLSAFIWSNVELTSQWQEYTLQLSSNVKYIAFHYYGNYAWYVYLDDITIGDNGIPIGEWINVNNVAGTTTEIIDLDPETNYLWQVRGNNTGCNGNGVTRWSKKASFTTRCGSFYVDADNPFTEGFEGTDFAPACWETFSTVSYQWTRNTYSGYVYSGSASAFCNFQGDSYLVLPDIEISANASAAQLNFWSYNGYDDFYAAGNNSVVLLNGETETVLWSPETVENDWVETTVDLTAYIGQTVRLAFKYAGNNANDWYVDNVEVSVTPAATVTQTIELAAGWNWVSLSIEVENPIAMLQMLEAGMGANGIQIKSGDVYTEYDAEWGWFGDLDELGVVNEQMYKIHVSAPCTITLEGMPINPEGHAITINKGWNWIGFPSAVAMSLDDAFAGFAQDGDIIRNSDGETPYDAEWEMWIGDLETLEPGQGYMYYSASNTPRTLVFPSAK